MQLIHGDAHDEVIKLSGIDTIITDPPYGLSFMGKKWDYDVPSVDFWRRALSACKPGATALVFAGSRTSHRMAVNMEEAGWILKDTIMWIYGSGFPKATDISKQIDKRGGANHLADECAKQLKEARESRGITKKQADEMFCGGTTNYSWFEGRPAGQRLPSEKESYLIMNEWAELKPLLEKIVEAEREVIGKSKHKSGIANQVDGHYTVGGTKAEHVDITASATPEAQLWNGWKSHGLKPAYEPIIVAMKPNDGTYANNALVHGVSGLNIDGGRIGTEEKMSYSSSTKEGVTKFGTGTTEQNPQGRFPANIILDEEVTDQEWSRYFYCAKASKKERNAGCEGLEKGCHHPTVKPLALMEYLCTLTKTPTGGVVLDPFMGSGTTGLACKNTGRDFIGVEREEEYIEIAKKRIHE